MVWYDDTVEIQSVHIAWKNVSKNNRAMGIDTFTKL